MFKKNVLLFTVCCLCSAGLAAEPVKDDFFSTIWERDHLFGDAGGVRSSLEKHGLTYDLTYTAEYFHNLRGGMRTRNGGKYRGDISFTMELDTKAAGLWDNGLFFLHLQEEHGYGITGDYVGDFQTLSNMDADDYKQVSEIWYRHNFFDGKFWVKLGKMEANADFAFVENGGEFLNSSAGFSPTIPLVTFPDQDWGIVLGFEPVDWFSMNVGIYQGRPNGGQSIGNTIDKLHGPMVMVEPAIHYNLFGQPGHLRLGGWWNCDKFDDYDKNDPDADEVSGSGGWYMTWDQQLYSEHPDKEGDEQGIGVFAQYGWSPQDSSEVEHYLGGGVQWVGMMSERDDDILGFGVFHVNFSDYAGFEEHGETAIELFYKIQCGWLSIKPDLQYIIHPGGSEDNAIAAGVRVEISF